MSDFPPTTAGGAAADDARGPSPLGDTSSAEGGENKKRNSIADRFLNAKEEQRKREEERRSNFKSQRGSENLGSITGRFEAAKQEQIEKEESRRSSFKTQNTSSLDSASSITGRFENAQKEQAEKERMKKENIKASRTHVQRKSGGKWEDILEESKTKEKERFEAKRLSTLSQYQTTQGSGVVKRRIGEFEVLFMQKNVNIDQIEATVRAALVARRSQAVIVGDGTSEFPESFVIGSTRVYEASFFEPECKEFLLKLISDSSGKPTCLPCGVYAGEKAPPIDVVVVAFGSAMDDGEFLAVSIDAQKGSELDALAYGVKRIEVFSPTTNLPVFERIYDIVPQAGWESWTAEAEMSNPDIRIRMDETNVEEELGNDGEEELVNDDEVDVVDSVLPLDDDFMNRHSEVESPSFDAGPDLIQSSSPTRESRSDTIRSITPSTMIDEVKDDQDFTLEETTNKGFQPSSAIISPVRIFLPGAGEQQDHNDQWDELADEETGENVPSVNVSEIQGISAFDISSVSCTKTHVVFTSRENDKALSKLKYVAKSSSDLQENYEAKFSDEQKFRSLVATQGSSLLATASLKSKTATSMNCLIDDKVFEWVRGAAMTGWVIKYPRATEKSLLASKNFLVLRDNMLAYYQAPPYEFSFMGSEALKSQAVDLENCIVLTAKSTVKISRMRLRTCIKVDGQNDTLYFRCPNVEERTRWLVQLQLAIQNLTKPVIFAGKARVQCTWYHDSPFLYNVASDVLTFMKPRSEMPDLAASTSSSPTSEYASTGEDSVEAFVYGSLFCMDYIDKDIDTSLSEPMFVHRLLASYSLDITLTTGSRFQRILKLDSSSGCSLNLMRVLNENTICVAGNNGLIGLVSISPQTSTEPSLDYAQNPNYELRSPEDSEGADVEIQLKEVHPIKCSRADGSQVHPVSSTIHCVAVASPSSGPTLFAAGDSQGILSLWTLDGNNSASFQDSLNTFTLDPQQVQADSRASTTASKEPIKTLRFSPDRKFLAVGAAKRLILISIAFDSGRYSFSSWIQADGKYSESDSPESTNSSESCIYAMAFERKPDSELFATILWKLTTFVELPRSRGSTPVASPKKVSPPSSGSGIGLFGRLFSNLLKGSTEDEIEEIAPTQKTNSVLHRIACGQEDFQRMLGRMIPI